jgi:hypothetical protein
MVLAPSRRFKCFPFKVSQGHSTLLKVIKAYSRVSKKSIFLFFMFYANCTNGREGLMLRLGVRRRVAALKARTCPRSPNQFHGAFGERRPTFGGHRPPRQKTSVSFAVFCGNHPRHQRFNLNQPMPNKMQIKSRPKPTKK